MSIPPSIPDDDDEWDAEPTQQRPSVNPRPTSSAPPTLENEEESWDAAFEQARSQSSIPAQPVAASESVRQQPLHALGQEPQQQQEPQATPPEPPPTTLVKPAAPLHAEQPAQLSLSTPRGEAAPGNTRLLLLIVAAAMVGGLWFFLRSKGEPLTEASTSTRSELDQRQVAKGPQVSPPAVAVNVPSPAANEDVRQDTARDTRATAEPPSAPEQQVQAPAPAPAAADLIVVTVTTVPPDARFFYKGKAVGHSPFRVELKPGERRAFEIGRPGYHARKVVVDGKKTEMTVAMRPEAR